MITYKVTVDEIGTVEWYNENGQRHREDGPAIEWADGTVEWWLHNVKYPPTGPIMLKYNEQKKTLDMAESSTRL